MCIFRVATTSSDVSQECLRRLQISLNSDTVLTSKFKISWRILVRGQVCWLSRADLAGRLSRILYRRNYQKLHLVFV
uniref:IP11223p n=1 Tax=Drosophila melanogaster TaxID=7227 RepID=Q4V4R7_DROME|nr:IP11523p [Drosophila melanogaster]AAY55355.1 IP11223p [Drosophila melanogaster]